jgi:hypothetical protein
MGGVPKRVWIYRNIANKILFCSIHPHIFSFFVFYVLLLIVVALVVRDILILVDQNVQRRLLNGNKKTYSSFISFYASR